MSEACLELTDSRTCLVKLPVKWLCNGLEADVELADTLAEINLPVLTPLHSSSRMQSADGTPLNVEKIT